jgi:IS30 family transposase
MSIGRIVFMAQMGRPGLSTAQKAELWRRWKDGQSLSDIGRALGKHAGSVHGVVSANGGIIPTARRRSRLALTLAEREEISRGIAADSSVREIAAMLGRAPSTVSREIERHGGRDKYRAADADCRAWDQAKRPKQCLLATNDRLQMMVATKLNLDWSPEQISGWLKLKFPNDESMQVSHETIYRSLFIQARGVLKKELIEHLRSRRMMRRSKKATTDDQPRGQIVDGISIRERPAEVEDRAIPGHWEGDLITGSKNTHIAILVERQSRFTMLVKVKGKDTASVVAALSKQVRKLPAELRKSLTWDRGTELANHKKFTIATNVPVYFCDPQSPWQRGTNENTNRLLRQYFPKGTELSGYSQADLNKIALRLNQRPRKTLGFQTPASKLNAVLQ